jgi:hypothetical protein
VGARLRYAYPPNKARMSAMRTRRLLAATCAFTCALAITAWAGGAGFGDDDDNSEEEGPSAYSVTKLLDLWKFAS